MVLLTLILLSGCKTVNIDDSAWTGSLGYKGGVEFHTMTVEEKTLTFQEIINRWNDLDHPQVMTSMDTLLAWKADLEKLCTDSQECTYDQKQTQMRLIYTVTRLQNLKE